MLTIERPWIRLNPPGASQSGAGWRNGGFSKQFLFPIWAPRSESERSSTVVFLEASLRSDRRQSVCRSWTRWPNPSVRRSPWRATGVRPRPGPSPTSCKSTSAARRSPAAAASVAWRRTARGPRCISARPKVRSRPRPGLQSGHLQSEGDEGGWAVLGKLGGSLESGVRGLDGLDVLRHRKRSKLTATSAAVVTESRERR